MLLFLLWPLQAFEVAETKLGLPALLDPEDLASANSPDPLGVITYISQFYYLFSRKPCGLFTSLPLYNLVFIHAFKQQSVKTLLKHIFY